MLKTNKQTTDIECDTSELLPEGVIHKFPTLLPSLLIQKGKKNQKNPQTNQGLL